MTNRWNRVWCLGAILLVGQLTAVGRAAPAAASHGPIGAYSVRGDVDDQLYRINLTTGTATSVGATGFGDIEALAFGPDGSLYGVDDATNQLVKCDVLTGACTAVGPLGVAITDMGLTFDVGGTLWMATDVPQILYRVDPSTGAATEVGPQGQQVTALAADGSVIYGLGGDGTNNLVRMNTATGAAVPVGPLNTVNVSDGGLEFAPGGTLYGLQDAGQIFTVDKATGAATTTVTTLGGFENLAILDHAPVGAGDTYGVTPEKTLNVKAPGVLTNDSDPDGDPLRAELATDPSNGTLTLAPDGSFSYKPNGGFVGTDTFRYRASDGAARSGLTTVTLLVAECRGKAATILGTTQKDVITGTNGNDVIASLKGGDRVHGRGGKDRICLGRGSDRGSGGSGNDSLFGDGRSDRLDGGGGLDRCVGGAGSDSATGCEREKSVP